MATTKSIVTETDAILKVNIDNNWSALDFAEIFYSINQLYRFNKLLVVALEAYEYIGKEYNWDERITNLPVYRNLYSEFYNMAFNIFSDKKGSRTILFYDSYLSFGPDIPVQVKSVKFGSKGSIDLLGIGKIFEIVKDLVINYIPNKERNVDILLKQKEIEEKEQKILQMKIENLKKLGMNTEEILSLIGFESIHIRQIKERLEYDKIQSIEIDKLSNE